MNYDIVIVGGGPVGLACACSMIKSKLKIALIDKAPLKSISNPKADGREVALTQESKSILKNIGAWDLIKNQDISPLKYAKVFDGDSNSSLNFEAKDNVGELGYLVPNKIIKKVLFDIASKGENIDIINDISVEDVFNDNDEVKIKLSNNKEITAKLIVAADSRFSKIRNKLGIPFISKDFSKVMIITKMQHDKEHNNTALEFFNYGHTLATLPLNGNISSAVLTVSTNEADKFLNLSEEDFVDFINKGINYKLGNIKQYGKRYSYPLTGLHAQKFIANRAVLIGDAAVAMHPVTAHGFNLGLRGQKILSENIYDAINKGFDIGSDNVLRNFQKKHIYLTRLMFFGTNGIVDLFTNDNNTAKKVRKLVINLADKFPPIKFLITKHLSSAKKTNLFPF